MPNPRPHKPRAKAGVDATPARGGKGGPAPPEQVSGGSHGTVDELGMRRYEAPYGTSGELREVEGYGERIAPAESNGGSNGEKASRRLPRQARPPR